MAIHCKPLILVVDDDEIISLEIRDLLEYNSYDAIYTLNGREAIIKAQILNPDLILLDLCLPDIDGNDVIRQLRTNFKNPILAISARNTASDRSHTLSIGANEYIAKPLSPDSLLSIVASFMKSGEHEQYRMFYRQYFYDILASLSEEKRKTILMILSYIEYNLKNHQLSQVSVSDYLGRSRKWLYINCQSVFKMSCSELTNKIRMEKALISMSARVFDKCEFIEIFGGISKEAVVRLCAKYFGHSPDKLNELLFHSDNDGTLLKHCCETVWKSIDASEW